MPGAARQGKEIHHSVLPQTLLSASLFLQFQVIEVKSKQVIPKKKKSTTNKKQIEEENTIVCSGTYVGNNSPYTTALESFNSGIQAAA